MQWFRLYGEFATDPVVQSLSFDDQRHFVMLLCLKSTGVLDKKFPAEDSEHEWDIRMGVVARALGLSVAAADEAMNRLCCIGLIGTNFQPKNWDKRQFISDSDPTAADRKRKQRLRESHRDVTRDSRPGHTPQNQITDTDTEKNKTGEGAPAALPPSIDRKTWDEWMAYRRERRFTLNPRALSKHTELLAKYDAATQRLIVDRSINSNWQGLFHPKANDGASKPKSTWRPPAEDADVQH